MYPQNLHTPKNIYFSENPPIIEIQNFEQKKMTRAYVCMKISGCPLGCYRHFRVKSTVAYTYRLLHGIENSTTRILKKSSFQFHGNYVYNMRIFHWYFI